MIALIQRVIEAGVSVEGKVVAAIGGGVLALIGVERDDGEAQAERLAERVLGYRIFPDAEGRMNRSLVEAGGALLAASGVPVDNGVMLQGSSLPQTTTVLAIRSQVQANGGAGVLFGDGLLCLAAPVTRLTGRISHGGLVSIPLNHGAGPGNFHYQLWYRNLGPFCTPDKFNLSNGLSAFWP